MVSAVQRQRRCRYALLLALCEASATMTLCAQMLSLLSPDHWCAEERVTALRLQLPLSPQEAKVFSLPPVTIGLPLLQLWTRGNASLAYSQCRRYDGDMAAAYITWMVARRPSRPTTTAVGQPTTECDQGWEYNTTSLYPTIASQHDWVCGDSWRPYFVQTTHWVGATAGALLFGLATNKFGRTPVLLASTTCILLGDVLTMLLASFGFIAVLASRFIAGLGCLSLQYVAFVHVREVCGSAHHAWLLLAAMTSRTVSILLVAAVALVTPSWWCLLLAPTLVSFLCLLLTCRIYHESPWWLLERDRPEQALKVLHRITAGDTAGPKVVDLGALQARYAAAMQTRDAVYEFCQCCKHRKKIVPFDTLDNTAVPSKLCRKHDVILSIIWLTCGMSYQSQLQASPWTLDTAGDSRAGLWHVVSSCWLGALAEVPAHALPHLLMMTHGGGVDIATTCLRTSTVAAAVLSVTCALLHSAEAVFAVLAALNRLSSVAALCSALHILLRCRLPHTRLASMAATMAAYGLGAAFAPAVNYLMEYNTRLPYLTLGVVNFAGAMLSLGIPRTPQGKPWYGCWRQMASWAARCLPGRVTSSHVRLANQHQPANTIVISSIPYNQLEIS